MIVIKHYIRLHEDELVFRFARASGPGGQNVNKVATAAELRFDVVRNRSIPEPVKVRLIQLAGRRITSTGEFIIFAQRFRTQERNRADAVQRLTDLISLAAEIPKSRKPTKPSHASKSRRVDSKRRQSKKKHLRHTSSEA